MSYMDLRFPGARNAILHLGKCEAPFTTEEKESKHAENVCGIDRRKEGMRDASFGYSDLVKGILPTGVRLEPEPSLRLTLRFLGDVDRSTAHEMVAYIWDSAPGHDPMRLQVDGLGMFEGSTVVFARLSGQGLDALNELQADVELAALGVGLPAADFPFLTPHINIGRLRGDAGAEDFDNIRTILEHTQPAYKAELWANEIALYV